MRVSSLGGGSRRQGVATVTQTVYDLGGHDSIAVSTSLHYGISTLTLKNL